MEEDQERWQGVPEGMGEAMISSFRGEHAFLSNFYPAPVFGFPTTEHYYQAAKSLNPADWKAIMATPYPGRAKRLGRKFKMRPDWEEIKFKVMEKALREKFKDPEIREALLATGDQELLEGNTWHDNDFGNCWCPKCREIPGKNMLGNHSKGRLLEVEIDPEDLGVIVHNGSKIRCFGFAAVREIDIR
jgi:ribA/ribD-fused uncharacterized protein